MVWQSIYSYFILPVFTIGVKILARKNKKLRDTLEGHINLWDRIEAQIKNRSSDKPLIWFHVASAGEYLQALPVMERLMNAGYECALTITSVSGYRWANKKKDQYPNLVLLDYLPMDSRANMQRLLGLIKPDVLVYVKFDLWPNLIWEANKKSIPQFLISATLQEKSKRVTWGIARKFYASIYQNLDSILTVTDEDKQRFLHSNPNLKHVVTVGDTRFDSVLDRKKLLTPPNLPSIFQDKPVLILGSVWPADEQHIFPAILKALEQFPDLHLIIAPHETDAQHINAIENTFQSHNIQRFTQLEKNTTQSPRIIVVDTVGHLSSLYFYADIAYVGGAFSTGVHNTMEPAAMGVPAIFGPFYQNSPEAMNMVKEEKCFSIKSSDEFESILFKLVENETYRKTAGQSAALYIETQAGASDACFSEIKDCIA